MEFKDYSRKLHNVGGHDVGFAASAIDERGGTSYYGFLTDKSCWLIMAVETTPGFVKYIFGRSAFETNWADRENLTYSFYDDALDNIT